MGALEAPQDRHGQEHRTGTSRAEQTIRRPWRSWQLWRPWRCRELRRPWRCRELWRPWRSWDLWRPWQMVFGGLGLGPLGPAPTAGTLNPPPKISLGKLGGIRSPPGLNTQHDSTKHNSPPGPDRQDRTAHRNQKPSRAGLEAEASSSTSATEGQAARMASMATTRGAACPRRVSVDMTDKIL